MRRQISFYDYDPEEVLTCERCGTAFAVKDTVEFFEELMDVRCPKCDLLILLITATDDQTREAAGRGDERALRDLRGMEEREAFLERAGASELKDRRQLPPIRRWGVVIDWDFEERDGENWTVLRHDGRELFRERAYWEGYERFVEVAKVLRERYGRRLRGLHSTQAADAYLLGDRLWTIEAVDRLNERLAAGRPPT